MQIAQAPARRSRRWSAQQRPDRSRAGAPVVPAIGASAYARQALPLLEAAVRGVRSASFWLPVLGLGILDGLQLWQGGLRTWTWSASLLLSGAAALLCILAGQRGTYQRVAWYAAAGGCLSILVVLLSRGPGEVAGLADDLGFLGAVLFFLVAAVARQQGEGVWLRRGKLLLDVAIIVIAPFVLGLPISGSLGVAPEEERLWSTTFLYLGSLAVLPYAALVAARGDPAGRRGSSALWYCGGMAALALAAGLAAIRSTWPVLASFPLGQPLWAVAPACIGLAAWRAAGLGTAEYEPGDVEAGERSRLRLLPAVLAGGVVAAVAVEQAGLREPPSAALFFGSSSLCWLIVSRLLVTLTENRRLVRRLEAAGQSQLALRELGLALNTSLEQERVWRLLCETGRGVVGADSVVLWLGDRGSRHLEAVEVLGGRKDGVLGRRLSLDDRSSLAVRVFKTRTPEVVLRAQEARRSHQLLTVMRGVQSLLGVPLRKGRRTLGTLVFAHMRDPEAFDADDVARVEVLVNQAVVALENAQLYQEARRGFEEMAALYDYALATDGATSSEEIAQELLCAVYGRERIDLGTVLFADAGMLVSARGVVLRRLGAELEPAWDVPPVRPSPLAVRAFRSGQVQQAAAGDRDFSPRLPESMVQLAAPVTLKDRSIGVVELESADPGALGEATGRLVAALARHAALAIDNLRLEEDTREVANLKKLDRMKTELLGTVSHELRTPLASIKGYATTMLELEESGGLSDEERREFLQVIDSESDRLRELISNLLDMSRIEAGVMKVDPAPVRLGRLMKTAAERTQHMTELHRVLVDWRSDRLVMADAPRVLQVVTNLLANAVKYSPEGGDIRIGQRVGTGWLEVSVADQGVGIPPRELPKVFDRFHRVEGEISRRVGGTGLGLAISKGLVEAHGGRIWVESEPGVGSVFTFTLPLCREEEEQT